MNRNKYQSITEDKFKQTINEEYQRARKLLNPLLKGHNRSFVKFYWSKNYRDIGGSCMYKDRIISFNNKYRDLHSRSSVWSFENFILTLRHEIVHLIVPDHSGRFRMLLKIVGGHERVGQPIYTGRSKNK